MTNTMLLESMLMQNAQYRVSAKSVYSKNIKDAKEPNNYLHDLWNILSISDNSKENSPSVISDEDFDVTRASFPNKNEVYMFGNNLDPAFKVFVEMNNKVLDTDDFNDVIDAIHSNVDNIYDINVYYPYFYQLPYKKWSVENIKETKQQLITMFNTAVDKSFNSSVTLDFNYPSFNNDDAKWFFANFYWDLPEIENLNDYMNQTKVNDIKDAIKTFDFQRLGEYIESENTDDALSITFNNKGIHLTFKGEYISQADNMGEKVATTLIKLGSSIDHMLSQKTINGMNKDLFVKSIDVDVAPLYDNKKKGVADDSVINELVQKVIANHELLLKIYNDNSLVGEQVIQKIFNKSYLSSCVKSIGIENMPQKMKDSIYKYIPVVMQPYVSDEVIWKTTERTLKRIVANKARVENEQANIKYLITHINPELFEKVGDELLINLTKKTNYFFLPLYIQFIDEDEQIKLIFHLLENKSNSTIAEFFDSTLDNLSARVKLNIVQKISLKIVEFPKLLKYIDNINNYMLIYIINYAENFGEERLKKVQEELISNNLATVEQIKRCREYLNPVSNYDIDSFGNDSINELI